MRRTVNRRAVIRRAAWLAALAIVLSGCDAAPSPSPTDVVVLPTPAPTAAPSQVPQPTSEPTPSPVLPTGPFPLAVVTGLTNLKAWTTLDELADLAAAGSLRVPCGVTISAPPSLAGSGGGDSPCLMAEAIPQAIRDEPETIALLPPGLVEPATKVLPIGGDGPFGLGGADLFGSKASREQPYPIVGEASGTARLSAEWVAHDPAVVWTLVSLGGSCLDRNVAYAALELGHGWDWVMDGGTARYRDIRLNPNPPAGVSQELVVDAVPTGNRGAVPRLVSGADVTVDDFDCTLNERWRPNYGRSLVFSTDAAVLPLLAEKLGIDVMKLAGNHASDFGATGTRTTLRLLGEAGILGIGVGGNLNAALEPGYLEIAGLKLAFLSWNDVPGSVRAAEDTTGVAWLRRANVLEGVRRAREAGADVVLCLPEWWGGAEYHNNLAPKQLRQLGWFDEAGCDHVLGHGTHVAGPMLLRRTDDGTVSLVMGSHGNYLFGQNWWQQVQEGVILEASFRGAELANVRLHPYVMLEAAQASLLDPTSDGRHVLRRVWRNSDLDAG